MTDRRPFPLTAADWYTRTMALSHGARAAYVELALYAWAHGMIPAERLAHITRLTRARFESVQAELLALLQPHPPAPDVAIGYTDPWVETIRADSLPNPVKQRAGRLGAQAKRQHRATTEISTGPVEIRVRPVENPPYPVENAVENAGVKNLRTSRSTFPVEVPDQEPGKRSSSPLTPAGLAEQVAYGILLRAPQGTLPVQAFKEAVFTLAKERFLDPVERDQVVATAWSPVAWRGWGWLTYDDARKRLSVSLK